MERRKMRKMRKMREGRACLSENKSENEREKNHLILREKEIISCC